MNPKQRAAQAALKFVKSGMVVGLGTGSTADCFLVALREAMRSGALRDIVGVPTSIQSENRAIELGIPLVSMADHPHPDVTVDGADEIDPNLNLIKGLGGALLREKIVAQNSKIMIVVADASKSVTRLGTKSPLPVEVASFSHQIHFEFLKALGAEPVLRIDAKGDEFITDNGNRIYDCRFPRGIDQPMAIQATLDRRAGVVDSGLFLDIATVALIASENGVEERRRPR